MKIKFEQTSRHSLIVSKSVYVLVSSLTPGCTNRIVWDILDLDILTVTCTCMLLTSLYNCMYNVHQSMNLMGISTLLSTVPQWPNLMYISTFEQNKILQNTILI